MDDFKGNCDISNAYTFNTEDQMWEIWDLDEVFKDRHLTDSVGADITLGLLVRSNNECSFEGLGKTVESVASVRRSTKSVDAASKLELAQLRVVASRAKIEGSSLDICDAKVGTSAQRIIDKTKGKYDSSSDYSCNSDGDRWVVVIRLKEQITPPDELFCVDSDNFAGTISEITSGSNINLKRIRSGLFSDGNNNLLYTCK